jgi:hypothetical protein
MTGDEDPWAPVYTQPYSTGQPPENLSREDAYKWFLETPGIPVPASLVKELTSDA